MSESDALSRVVRTRTADGATDIYDHEISLVDATAPQDGPDGTRSRSPSSSRRDIVKKPTRESIRERLGRRKYAKWQKERFSSEVDENAAAVDSGPPSEQVDGQTGAGSETATTDFAKTSSERGRKGKGKRTRREDSDTKSVIDVLYENQRGWFFFGIPLYSHSSLLNLDPAPWMTKDFNDSAVDITNAQVPDPSWSWAWKKWYVDMSYDVDEEGWQYSFSFGKQWVWHGSHPWFHSFVRRRRWLRRRVKRGSDRGHEKAGSLGNAHGMTDDYFTIHSGRNRSPDSHTAGASMTRPRSYISASSTADTEQPPEDIKDIPTLFKALRLTKVDREKVDCVKKFIDQGGEELAYLKGNISEIMSLFVFDNSRRRLIAVLQQSADQARKEQDEHEAEEKMDKAAKSRRMENIIAALEAAKDGEKGLADWTDRRDTLRERGTDGMHDQDNHPADNIKGISDDAETEIDPTSRLIKAAEAAPGETPDPKGKGKEVVRDGTLGDVQDYPLHTESVGPSKA